MKPTPELIEALDHFTEMRAARLNKNLRNMLMQFLTMQDVGENDFFPLLMHDLYQVFLLLDTIEKEQRKVDRLMEIEEE